MALHTFLLLLGISLAGGLRSGVFGGEEAKPYSRPYMASIQINKHHKCGGMLIREDYVLTAAHCLNSSDYSGRFHFDVVLGAHNISKNEKSQQRIQVRKSIRHPKFQLNNKKDYSYDIMLLQLKKKAKLCEFVKIMPLFTKIEDIPADGKCSIAGWGFTNPKGQQASKVMHEVTLKLQKNSVCEEKWAHHFNTERMLCGVSDGIHGFCMGDSGSPLICGTKPQGIASYTFKDDCANTDYPQVYVKTSHFLHWIKKMIG